MPKPITATAITTPVVELEPVNASVELGAADDAREAEAPLTHTLYAATAAW